MILALPSGTRTGDRVERRVSSELRPTVGPQYSGRCRGMGSRAEVVWNGGGGSSTRRDSAGAVRISLSIFEASQLDTHTNHILISQPLDETSTLEASALRPGGSRRP